MRLTARWRAWASHHRVHVGIFFALFYVAFSRPDATRLLAGALIVVLGEGIRVWACGYLVRNEELTRDGPYQMVRHPLYLGSLLIGLGLSLLAQHGLAWAGSFAFLYLAFYLPAMYVAELRLQSLFGAEYQEYAVEAPRLLPRLIPRPRWDNPPSRGSFSWSRAVTNQELRSAVAMAALLLLQWLKSLL